MNQKVLVKRVAKNYPDQVVSERSSRWCEPQAWTIQRAAMEDFKDMYEAMLRMSERVDMLYEYYKKQAADNVELNTLLQEEK